MPEKIKMFGHESKPKHNFNTSTRVSNPFYHTTQWRKIRLMVLARDPFCRSCESLGYYVATKVADHIIPIEQGGSSTSIDNLQGLCTRCHNSKSGKEKKQWK